jgi:hypothetical protein
LTTVPSIKAMLEPRIVAARIQRPLDLEQGTIGVVERRSGSSQGTRTETDTPN